MSTDSVKVDAPAAQDTQSKSGSGRGKYVTQACKECRRRRAKCNGIRPSCTRCIERQLPCIYDGSIDHRGSAPRSLVSLLQSRVKLLEEVIQLHSIDLDASIAQIQGRGSSSEESTERLSGANQVSESGSEATRSEMQGVLYSEQPSAGHEDQARFFGPASGRLDLQPAQAAPSSAVPDRFQADRSREPRAKVVNSSQQRFSAYSQSLASEALGGLPPELIENLIDLYFEWEQPWFQIVDEGLFRTSRLHSGRYYSPVLLCCIIAAASRYSDRPEVRSDPQDPNTAGLMFLEHAEALIHFDLKWPSITTIQSLAIMAIVYVAVGSDAAGWLHHGMATRLVIDMGLNIDTTSVAGSACLSTQDVRLRRQIYWALYCSDKLFASYTGRICTMLDSQGSIPLPGTLEPVDGGDGPLGKRQAVADEDTFLVSFQRAISTHCQILESILTKMYAPKDTMTSAGKQSFFNSTLLTLQDWLFFLPRELKIKSSDRSDSLNSSPHVFILHMVYHTSVILLAKPFVSSNKVQSAGSAYPNDFSKPQDDVGRRALRICHEAATETCLIGKLYRERFGSFRRSPLTATHCTLMACVVKLYLADKAPFHTTDRTTSELTSCMLTLRGLSDSWTPARRYWEVLTRARETTERTGNAAKNIKTRSTGVISSDTQSGTWTSPSEVNSLSDPLRQWQDDSSAAISEGSVAYSSPMNAHVEDPDSAAAVAIGQNGTSVDFDKLDFSALSVLPWDYAFEANVMDFWQFYDDGQL